ncbi:UNVERIFIED_CONTAM: hypothetical protein NCL1_55754 [Trichonephila clavipes]
MNGVSAFLLQFHPHQSSLLRITGLRSSLSFITSNDISSFFSTTTDCAMADDPHYASELVPL